jgi:hypothetical protein
VTTAKELSEILSKADAGVRTLYFGAMLAREAGIEDGRLIVVGGSAIEAYTRGGYVSADIDIVADRARLVPILESWGFRHEGRTWLQHEWKIAVDIVRDFDRYHGSLERTEIVQTPYGPVRLEAVEDAMVRRLISSRYWHLPRDFDLAVEVAATHAGDIDWSYAGEIAKLDGVSDLLAELRRRIDA